MIPDEFRKSTLSWLENVPLNKNKRLSMQKITEKENLNIVK